MKVSDAPVWITGLGAVSVWGWDATSLWQGLLTNRTGVGPPKHFKVAGHRTRIVSEAPERPTDDETPPSVAMGNGFGPRSSRTDHFALAAADEAWRHADLPDPASFGRRCGVFFGTSTAGMAEAERYFNSLTSEQRRAGQVGPLRAHPLNNPGDAVARALGIRGPVRSFSSACASGALAIAAALDALRCGEVDVAIAGGSDALCQLTYAGFNALRVVDEAPCRPFRQHRAGLSLGEGAGVVVLETAAAATARGAVPLACLVGAGASCDAHHMTAPHPRGDGAAMAVQEALGDAGLTPSAVSFINAHGTGTPRNDSSEWQAVEQVFGDRASHVWVTSTKGSVGHLLGSSGAIEAVATVQCLQFGTVHPTPGDDPIDEAMSVDLVTGAPRALPTTARGDTARGDTARPAASIAVSTSFGFGGANAALVFAGKAITGETMTGEAMTGAALAGHGNSFRSVDP